MPVTDPISDMLTRIRNAIMVHHDSVSIPASKLKESLLRLMREEGFIKDFVKKNGDSREVFEVNLRYYDDDTPVINGLKRISKPGLREYVGKKDLPLVNGGLGIAVVSTSKGLMTDKEAREAGIGGELLCSVF